MWGGSGGPPLASSSLRRSRISFSYLCRQLANAPKPRIHCGSLLLNLDLSLFKLVDLGADLLHFLYLARNYRIRQRDRRE